MQAFEKYLTATNLTSLDELYAEPALADTLYGHVVMGAMSSDEFADGDRLQALYKPVPALMVKTHLLTYKPPGGG